MTGKIEMFDYGTISDEHKAAASEIVNMCNEMGQPLVAEFIKHKFKLVEPKRFDFKSSSFVKACEEAGIFVSVQGFVAEGTGPNEVQYQLCAVNEDIRKLDKFIDSLTNK
jgi:hypothetical protein